MNEKEFKSDIVGFIDDNLPLNKIVFNGIRNIGTIKDIEKLNL